MPIRLECWGVFGAGWTIDSDTPANSGLSAAGVANGLTHEANQPTFRDLKFIDVLADATPDSHHSDAISNPRLWQSQCGDHVGSSRRRRCVFTEVSGVEFRSDNWTSSANHSLDSLETHATIQLVRNSSSVVQ